MNKIKSFFNKEKIIIIIVSLLILSLIIIFVNHFISLSTIKYNSDYSYIERYISLIDKDSDGIDDQTDIYNNARAYVDSRPKYKSVYYATGYPDDDYGVCTDVIGIALLNSGYDLMELVNEDILANRDLYDIDYVDKNIDFRRVSNLDTYFKRNATSLTLDVYNIFDWQPGDIVVFKYHIAIVSENRNKNGVPFVLHLSRPYQLFYEENILEGRDDIIGHYRIS